MILCLTEFPYIKALKKKIRIDQNWYQEGKASYRLVFRNHPNLWISTPMFSDSTPKATLP